MDLKDFQVEPDISLSDFAESFIVGDNNINQRTVAQLAASYTLAKSEGSPEDYRYLSDKLKTADGREEWLKERIADYDKKIADSRSELGPILLDENLPEEEKASFVKAAANRDMGKLPSTLDTFAQEAAVADNDPEETETAFLTRVEALDVIEDVNRMKRETQAEINAYSLAGDDSKGEVLKDLIELMVPFAEQAYYNRLGKDLGVKQSIFPGQQKKRVFEVWKNLPVSEREQASKLLLELVKDNDKLILPDGNDLVVVDALEKTLGLNDYSDLERWFDNFIGVADLVGLGFLLKGGAKLGMKAQMKATKAAARSVRSEVPPTAPSQVAKDANPEVATGLRKAVEEDPTGEAAEALYGASKEEALAKDILPEPELELGKVENKAPTKEEVAVVRNTEGPQFEEPENLKAIRQDVADDFLTDKELSTLKERIVARLEDVEGMSPKKETLAIRSNEDGTISFRMVYGPTVGGWRTAAGALKNAEFAFRKFGLTEKDFTLYARQGDKWVETTQKELAARAELRRGFQKKKKKIPAELKDLDYAVGLEYKYRFDPNDDIYEAMTIKYNQLDSLPILLGKSGAGSLTQHLVPPDSLFDPRITQPLNAAVDEAVGLRKAYVDLFREFTRPFSILNKKTRDKMISYIYKANLDGIPFNVADLRARGFNTKEIELLEKWRRANDALWYATNQDLQVSLRNRGYEVYKDASGSNLVVKPFKRKGIKGAVEVVDTTTGDVKTLSKTELDDLYNNGGYIAKSSQPFPFQGGWYEDVLVKNTPDSYTRAINDSDMLLSYREGYYPVMYDANFFIYRTIKVGGVEKEIVVGSAKTKVDAQHLVDNLIQQTPQDGPFDFRPNKKSPQDGVYDINEQGWSLAVSSGMSAQKIRGKRLIDAGSNLYLAGQGNLIDPLEAVANQIMQLSSKVKVRPVLEALKARWISNYKDLLKMPTDKFGNPVFPSDISKIEKLNTTPQKALRDARTLFAYIYSLENGYMNSVDNGVKAMLHYGADVMSDLGIKFAEKGVRDVAEGMRITQEIKGAAFKLFIALSPIRQLPVQANQMVQLVPLFPQYMLSGKFVMDMLKINLAARGLTKDAEALELYKQVVKSGILEAVDANNLVRKDSLRLADRTVGQKASRVAGAPVKLGQYIGFDIAERAVLVSSWLAHRDAAIREGKKLNRRTYREIAGKSRAFTYSMNQAGDMPYTRNALNIIFQFLQVPHKAIMQPLTSRSLSKTEKLKLLTWNGAMYGVPTALMAPLIYPYVEDGATRDILEYGFEEMLLNKLLTELYGEEVSLAWSESLSPGDLYGSRELFMNIISGDLGAVITEAPAMSLFLGDNPRINNMFKTAAMYFNPAWNYEDPELAVKFSDVSIAFLGMSSGFSNYFKANYAVEAGKKMSSYGNITDSDVNKWEAAMQLAGIRTTDERGIQRSKSYLYPGKYPGRDLPKDVEKWYTLMKQHLARRGQSVKEADIERRVLSEAWRVFSLEKQEAVKALFNLVQADIKKGEFDFAQQILTKVGFLSPKEVNAAIESLPDGEVKDNLRSQYQFLLERRESAKRVGEELKAQ